MHASRLPLTAGRLRAAVNNIVRKRTELKGCAWDAGATAGLQRMLAKPLQQRPGCGRLGPRQSLAITILLSLQPQAILGAAPGLVDVSWNDGPRGAYAHYCKQRP